MSVVFESRGIRFDPDESPLRCVACGYTLYPRYMDTPAWDSPSCPQCGSWEPCEPLVPLVVAERPAVVAPRGNQRALALRFRILKRDGYRCQLCGATAADGVRLEVDHKVARANGGSDEPGNLWVLCFPCNRGKRTQDL